MILFILFLSNLFAAAPSPTHPLLECEPLLRRHIQSATDVRPWKELPEDLARVSEATLLIRLPLGVSNDIKLSALSRLVEGSGDLAVPEPLKIVSGFGLFAVARGSQEALLNLHARVKAGLPGATVQYQILGYSQLRDFAIPFPDRIYRSEEAVAGMIEKEAEAFIGFSPAHGGQLLFFIPRDRLMPLIDEGALEGSRINQYRLRNPPRDWVLWMEDKADFFSRKGLVIGSYWAVLSAKAFEAVKALEAEYSAQNAPRGAQISDALSRALERCFAEACAVQAPPAVDNSITYASRRLVLDVLKDHRKTISLSAPNGIRQAFLALADLIPDEEEKRIYVETIRNIPFVPTEYLSVSKDDVVTNSAIRRMAQAWRAFLTARKLPQAGAPLTKENIKAAVEAIES